MKVNPVRGMCGGGASGGAEAGDEIEESEELNDHLKYPTDCIGMRRCRLTGGILLKLELC